MTKTTAAVLSFAAIVTVVCQPLTAYLLWRINMNQRELIDLFREATNRLGERFQAHNDKLTAALKAANGELSPELEAEARAIKADLDAMGTDPANPVPEPIVVEPTEPLQPEQPVE